MSTPERVRGDFLGHEFPTHVAALRDGGAHFLTQAFRAAGAIGADNRVSRVLDLRDCPGGSTGRKALLRVEYANRDGDLHGELFVKFSRDFDDALRDRARFQMEREVAFALLSRQPDFPVDVARCYFADFHRATGSGILITRRVRFGEEGIEAHREKCLDYELAAPLEHYRALVSALARLAGAHRAGALPDTVERDFPFDPAALAVSRREPYDPPKIRNRVSRYAEFAARFPQLLPAPIRDGGFIARLLDEAPRFVELSARARACLRDDPRYVALCHWNANIDNAWFWREGGRLHCGLLDWGNVGQMHVAMALWGALSAAETDLWNDHLDELLALFCAGFADSGGPELDPALLRRHLVIHGALMGLEYMLDAPPLIRARVAELDAVRGRRDPRIREDETARTQLQIMTVFLNLWEREDMADILAFLARYTER